MKLFKQKREEKSWALDILEGKVAKKEHYVTIAAVDSYTGEKIANLITFMNGEVFINHATAKVIADKGYDPYEHGNKFNENGALVTC